MSKISLKDALFNRFKAVRLLSYIEVPISRTLDFSNLPITRAKRCSLRSNDHCNFTFDLSHYPFFEGNSFRFENLGFQCISEHSVVTEWLFCVTPLKLSHGSLSL